MENLTNKPIDKEVIDAEKVSKDTNIANANYAELLLNMVGLSNNNFFTGVNTLAQEIIGNLKLLSTTYLTNLEHQLLFNAPVAIIDTQNFNLTARLPKITTGNIGNIIYVFPKNLTNTATLLTYAGDVLNVTGNNKVVFNSLDSYIKLMPQKTGKWLIIGSNNVTLTTV